MAAVDRSLIADMPLFGGFDPGQLDRVLRGVKPVRHAKGSAVFEQDGAAHSFFLLLHGRLRVVRLTPDGQQVVVRFVGRGDVFGIAKAIGRDTYPGTAVAVVDSVALMWPSSLWPELLAEHPALALNAMQTMGARIQEAHTRVVEMSTEQVERRVAHALLRLANQAGHTVEDGIEIDFPISRQDVAEMTGTTLHTVSRILSGWELAGLVRGGRQRIVICEPHKLFMVAEGLEASEA